MPSQKCFSVKIRTGARTPFEASVTMLSVNDELMSLNGSAVRTSEIGERILGAINREFEKPLKAVDPAAQSGEALVQQSKPKMPTLEETKESVKEWLDCKPDFMPTPSPAEIVKVTHDYMCRQLRAGA